ncbi:MAG: aminotransferase class I/II-fold pyridoxal phosphate-dependent enzyme [Shimia sp.]
MTAPRDHGGALDAAIARWGGTRDAWMDLSTGIDPVPYPPPPLPTDAWSRLPDAAAEALLIAAARAFWAVPAEADILATPGASLPIALLPTLRPPGRVRIPGPTYNEHAASFEQAGWKVVADGPADAAVIVHPNNPTGALHPAPTEPLAIVDESFCDTMPDASLIAEAARPGRVVLKSFGKFWGLAGLRLGFAIGDPALIGALRARIGPWAVSGPALAIGAAALEDRDEATARRARQTRAADALDAIVGPAIGGTPLFRLYEVPDAAAFADRLARRHILVRTFPYAPTWVRIGLPPDTERLAAALAP